MHALGILPALEKRILGIVESQGSPTGGAFHQSGEPVGTGRNIPALFLLIGSLKPNVGFLEKFVGNEGLMDSIPLNIVPDDLSRIEGILKDVGDIPFLKSIPSFSM